jgi:hypothetical protein
VVLDSYQGSLSARWYQDYFCPGLKYPNTFDIKWIKMLPTTLEVNMKFNANFVHLGRGGLVDLRTSRGARAFLGCEIMRLEEFPVTEEAVAAVMAAASHVSGIVKVGARDDDGFAALVGEVIDAVA